MPDIHAKLSASGAKRWLTCPPSIALEEQTRGTKETTSVFAEEGTAAHSLSELKLQLETGKLTQRQFTTRYNKFKKENTYYDKSMDDYTDDYVALVLESYRGLPNASIDLEVQVDFSKWVPGGFGTSDVVICSDNVIEVIDLKYGKGIPVSAIENPQIMLYGLGAFQAYDMIYEFDTVRMTICQPRLGDISTYELSVKDLLDWADSYVAPRAELAEKGEGEFCPSPDACQWCAAKAICKARADKNLEIAKLEFADPVELSKDEFSSILGQAKEIESWLKDVKEYCLEQVRDHSEEIPGWKLVEGRSNRKIEDEMALVDILKKDGYEESQYMKSPTLQTLTNLEKVIGKKRLAELAGDLIVKPVGAPTLVPESDKKPAINSVATAAAEFE